MTADTSWCNTPFLMKALAFATEAHKAQIRKYTNEPYINHPIEVATILFESFPKTGVTQQMLAAALLHDVVEDCGVTFTELRREFDDVTTLLVMGLTDLVTKAQGNRDTRKFLEAARVGMATPEIQAIKLCDFISNTRSIVEHDPDFAVVYLKEKDRVLQRIYTSWTQFQTFALQNDELVALYNRAVKQLASAEAALRNREETP